MELIFIDLGINECGEEFGANRLQVKYGTEWSATPSYSFDLVYGCTKGYLALFTNKMDLINHMIGERESFQELFPEHYQNYLDNIEYLKIFKH